MPGDKGLRRFIRLIWDRQAASKAERDAKRSGERTQKAWVGVAKKIAAGFAAAFAVQKVIAFGKAAIRAAREADVIWNRLEGTLRSVGIRFGDVELRVRAAARAMQDTTTIGDEQFADTLQQLVIISGDFEESLRNVAVVADVAAGAQIDLSTAADLVGRAMVGETGTLKRYGIIVEEGADAVEHMRMQFAGLAENEAQTLDGRMKQLSNEFSDFLQNLGDITLGFLEVTGVIEIMTRALRAANQIIERLRKSDREEAVEAQANALARMTGEQLDAALRQRQQEAARWAGRMADLSATLQRQTNDRLRAGTQAALDDAGRMWRAAIEDQAQIQAEMTRRMAMPSMTVDLLTTEELLKLEDERIKLLTRGVELGRATATEQDELLRIESSTNRALLGGNLALEERVRLQERLQRIAGATATIRAQRGLAGFAPPTADVAPITPQLPVITEATLSTSAVQQFADDYQSALAEMKAASLDTAETMTAGFESFFDAFADGVRENLNLFESVAEGLAAAGRWAIAQIAVAKAKEQVAEAASKLAAGIWPPNPAALLSASKHTAAAALWRALAGAVGGGGGRGGRGSAGGGLANRGTDGFARPDITRPEVHLYINGREADPRDPQWQRLFYVTGLEVSEVYRPDMKIPRNPTRGPS